MSFWQSIYSQFDPVAFRAGMFSVYWYGILYATALLSAILIAKWFAKRYKLPIPLHVVDSYFLWAELAIILGARLGWVLIYAPNTEYYLAHPWQIFNPFSDGEFTGIRGMSYHGAVFGFLIVTYIYAKKSKYSIWKLLDLVALSVPLAYVLGRIGNFLNQELVGRVTDVPWGIYVDGVLRHPSQLYEAFLEGVAVFVVVFIYRKYKKYDGELIAVYGIAYSMGRFIAEFWRQPDAQVGFIYGGWLTTGQLLSLVIVLMGIALYVYIVKSNKKNGIKHKNNNLRKLKKNI
ncbi:MAG: prolipoprotein diacylglyceryl transferase [Campylobacteraceae bacterium]|jgi:phosphatidylglycerol:prolipoprotein diacylglycerol transferase|nr:prolipoprotein diacylglyceryl transferase [Campylobacteraceae bacterium]